MKLRSILLLSVLGILLMLSGVAGSTPVQYAVYDPFNASDGTMLHNFDSTTGWTVGGVDAILSTSLQYTEGEASLSLTATNGNPASMTRSLVHDFSDDDNIVLWVYAPDITTANQVSIAFTSNVSWNFGASAKTFYFSTADGKTWFRPGWNSYVFSKNQFLTTNGESWNNQMVAMKIVVTPLSGNTSTFVFDDMRVNYSSTPCITFTFDDGLRSTYDYGYKIMKNNGQSGSFFILTNAVNNTPTYLLPSELREMQLDGWDISSHAGTHYNLSELNETMLDTTLQSSHSWLYVNNFGKGAYIMGYPFGTWNQDVVDATKKYYTLGRSGTRNAAQMHILPDDTTENYVVNTYQINDDTDIQTVLDEINNTIDRKGYLNFVLHGFYSDPSSEPENNVYNMLDDNFSIISDYVKLKQDQGQLVCKPMSYFMQPVIPASTPLKNKQVEIYQDGTVEIITTITTNDDTADGFRIAPSSDSVLVNVSTWTTDQKVWIESSTTEQNVTHEISGLPVNHGMQLYRDDILYENILTNSTGVLTWVYDGGFSEHEFSLGISPSDFEPSVRSGSTPATVKFVDNSTDATAWYWDFENDGVIDSTKQNPVHTYGRAGNYSVNLTVQNEYGNFSTVKTDYITVSAPTFSSDPVAWFNWVLSYLNSMFVGLWVAV